jgi:excisionase family DNA binding protein
MKDKTRNSSKIYTVSAAARLLGIAESTIRRLTNEGKLVCARDSSNRRLITGASLDAYQATVPARRSA